METQTINFDHHAEDFSQHRFELIEEIRNTHPVVWSTAYDGFWTIAGYDAAKRVLSQPEVFSSEKLDDGTRGVTIPSVGPRLMPAEVDAPVHTQLRKVAQRYYSPKMLKEFKAVVDTTVIHLIDRVVEMGEFDIVEDISEMLPPLIGLRHMGFPESERAEMVKAVKIGLSSEFGEEDQQNAFMAACGKMFEFVASKRNSPGDDLISRYIECEEPVLDDTSIMWIGMTMFVGGFKNPGAHISNALLHLARDPSLKAQLIEDRSLIAKANTEFLRLYTAGNSVARTATQDVELEGVSIKEGDRVLVLLGGANRDPSKFENPNEFNLNRVNNNEHIAFGGGPHFCIGFSLANMVFERLLNEIFDRMPNYTADAERATKVRDAGIQAGYVSIPANTGANA